MGHRAKWPWWGMGRGTVVGPGSPGGGWVRCRWSWWGMGQVQVVLVGNGARCRWWSVQVVMAWASTPVWQ